MKTRKSLSKLLSLVLLVLFISGCYSCKSYHEMKGQEVEPGSEGKFFWDKDCKVKTQEAVAVKAEPVEPACGTTSYPMGYKGVIDVEKQMPEEVVLNSEFGYNILVKNVSCRMLSDVVVYEQLSPNFKLKSSTPDAAMEDGKCVFYLGDMEANETAEIKLVGSAETIDSIQNCTTYSYLLPSCSYTKVVNPELMLEQVLPAETLLCEEINIRYTVTNPGTGFAKAVVIKDELPAGLKLKEGGKVVNIMAGDLAAGESKTFNVVAMASEKNTHELTPVATTHSGLKAEDEDQVAVVQPELKIAKSCTEKIYLGRDITYDISVENVGDAVATNVKVIDVLPADCAFVSATAGGYFADGKVNWDMASLGIGKTAKVSVTVKPAVVGNYPNMAKAMAYCAAEVSDSCETKVLGIPAILLEVIDVDDPLEIGGKETYVITATNQGTAVGTNIAITCELEDTQKYISASGPTNATLSGKTVKFSPLAKLAPKEKAVWTVYVEAVGEGDVRFTVKMISDQISRNVTETESTNQYK